jgi:hypothetical protein
MDIYFDESRNTGEISPKGSVLNYGDQRYFVLVGYIDSSKTTELYQEFKKSWHSRLQSKTPNSNEMKGNDLLRKDNTEIRNAFIDNFCHGNNLYITVYDKKFFLVTQMINWLIYRVCDYGGDLYDLYIHFCELLIKLDDDFLGKYISVTKSNDVESIDEFVKYVINYNYTECIKSPFESYLVLQWKSAILGIRDSVENYIVELKEDNVSNDWIKGKDRNNIVNLTALGETILVLKNNNPQLSNNQIRIHHDKIETVQEYINANWDYKNIEFISSDNSNQIQLSDNIASIVGNLVNRILPLNSDRDLVKLMQEDYQWVKISLRKIFNHINQRNTKFVIPMREMAVIKSILSGKEFTSFEEFKKDVMSRLQSRFETEKANHVNLSDASKILKR